MPQAAWGWFGYWLLESLPGKEDDKGNQGESMVKLHYSRLAGWPFRAKIAFGTTFFGE